MCCVARVGHKAGIDSDSEGRPCLDIAQQLHAVEKAVSQAKRTFIHDHLDDCLEHAVGTIAGPQRDAIEEFKEITKYL